MVLFHPMRALNMGSAQVSSKEAVRPAHPVPIMVCVPFSLLCVWGRRKEWYDRAWGKGEFKMVLWDSGLSARYCRDSREACFN